MCYSLRNIKYSIYRFFIQGTVKGSSTIWFVIQVGCSQHTEQIALVVSMVYLRDFQYDSISSYWISLIFYV